LEIETCNCYLSWNNEVLAAATAFQPATSSGAGDQYVKFDDHDQAACEAFIDHKRSQNEEIRKQRAASSKLYLPLADGEIRVLELYPGKDDAAFEGSLHIVSVDFAHPAQGVDQSYTRHTNHAISLETGKPLWYTALSYVWGIPVFDHSVQITNSESVEISSSLAVALYRLRSTQESIFLWIDQICIDQTDRRDKEQQIPLMGLIYTHATNTVIWLGDENGEEPSLAFETMEYVYARLQLSDVQITTDDFERLDFPPPTHRAWHAVRQLLQRPWLSRLWTIQEAVLSRNLFVKCGQAVVSWEDLAAWCYVLQHCNLLRWLAVGDEQKYKDYDASCFRPRLPTGGSIINSLQSDRLQSLMLQEKEYLLNSLVRTRYAQATESKDKIYGVLGITDSTITPDYSSTKTARDVYHEACLTQVPTLIYELLSSVDHDTPLKTSWVPDWSTDRVTEALGYSTKAWTLYRAGRNPKDQSTTFTGKPTKVVLSEDKKRITLSGIFFDKIATLGNIVHEATLDIDSPQTGNQSWAPSIQLIKDNYTHINYPVSSCSIYDAFWLTLLAGRDASGTSAPTSEHSDVFSLILDSTTGQMPSLPGQTYTPRRQKGFFTLNNLRSRRPAKTLEDLTTAMRTALTMRRFAITEKGYFALVPRGTREEDEIVVFVGACVPFVVRREEGGEGFELVGEAYVHGIMGGEVMGTADVEVEDVTLV
jgi:hypothetical protein